MNSPGINALNGWILLRVGDNITFGGLDAAVATGLTDAQRIAQNTKVLAGKWIDIYGDYNAFTNGSTDLDPGHGTVMHLHGTITPGPLTTSSPDCLDAIAGGAPRSCNITRIFGNTDTDTITFDQTYLGGRTRTYGSRTPTTIVSPAGARRPPRPPATARTSPSSTSSRR